MNYTPLARPLFIRLSRRTDCWATDSERIQRNVLKSLLRRASGTRQGRRYNYGEMAKAADPYSGYRRDVPMVEYEDIRPDVMRMIAGERDVLWRGRCFNFAQSSGTSGGRSKFVPVPEENLHKGHYKGSADCVAHYLRHNPESRLFSGKGFILGGSFATELKLRDPRVKVGDLSATLIDKINPMANFFRVPDKATALIPDWKVKLPALVKAASKENITNISGVPSWFLTVIKEIMKERGVDKISDVWPDLEVFFHGGISFEPYREEYARITDPKKMHFLETYNASEGFFAVQNEPDDHSMLLIIDNDVFYEFLPVDDPEADAVPLWEVEKGKVYEMVISSSNGLWRYRLGDTVRIMQSNPVKITIAGRTKCYINAFGEELMEENAEKAVATVCAALGAAVKNYTASPVFASGNRHGRHQWIVEWDERPADVEKFADMLDAELRKENSDYDAKRTGDIFLDRLELISVPDGTFDRWLRTVGNHKLGGQKKVPRLANHRRIADAILKLLE